MFRRIAGAIVCVTVLFGISSCQNFNMQDAISVLDGQRELTPETIASGLKEAIRIGAERASTSAAADGAYTGDTALHIPLPEQLQTVASTLRKVGLGGQVDLFERKMNEAAEQAALTAAPVFADAVRDLTFTDVKEIWQGGPTAATDYFREKTTPRLTALYQPIVERKLVEVGAVRTYDTLMQRYRQIPLVPQPQFSLTDYATTESLNGLFSLLAQEEARIRQDPAARSTELLRRVFGSR